LLSFSGCGVKKAPYYQESAVISVDEPQADEKK
jgi:hypothetical protein